MEAIYIDISAAQYRELVGHLLQPDGCEHAAFAFAEFNAEDSQFHVIELLAVAPDDCVGQSAYYLELSDGLRAAVIKQAHELDASLIEFHSHRSQHSAAFSISDFTGFSDFVPHVWWRLGGRPYAAVVVAESSLDALAWTKGPDCPIPVTEIRVDEESIRPTGLSLGGHRLG